MKLLFQFFQAEGKVLMSGEQFAQFDECTHNCNIHLDGSVAIQHAGEHRDTLFGEYEGQIAPPSPT